MTELIDYEQFCGSSATDKDGEVALLPLDQRITARKLAEVVFTKFLYSINIEVFIFR